MTAIHHRAENEPAVNAKVRRIECFDSSRLRRKPSARVGPCSSVFGVRYAVMQQVVSPARLITIAGLLVLCAAASAVAQAPRPNSKRSGPRCVADTCASRISPSGNGSDSLAEPQRRVGLRHCGRHCPEAGSLCRKDPCSIPRAIAIEWRRRRRDRPTAALVSAHVFAPAPFRAGSRVLLHFGAVDWESHVFVNGKEVGRHSGGYDPFSFDITSALKASGDSGTHRQRLGSDRQGTAAAW
jgi:hypothetical protein